MKTGRITISIHQFSTERPSAMINFIGMYFYFFDTIDRPFVKFNKESYALKKGLS